MPYLFEKKIGDGETSTEVSPSKLRMHVGYVTLASGTATYTIPELVNMPNAGAATAVFLTYFGGALTNAGSLSGQIAMPSAVLTVTSTNASDANLVLFMVVY